MRLTLLRGLEAGWGLKEVLAWLRFRTVKTLKRFRLFPSETYSPIIRILYHDKDYFIVDKPYRVAMSPSEENWGYELYRFNMKALLKERYSDILPIDDVRYCHRLDYITSGCLCYGLNAEATRAAMLLFRHRKTTKHYLALVWGHISDFEIDINVSIGGCREEGREKVQVTTEDDPLAICPKTALTRLYLLEHGLYDGKPASKILMVPLTGRTHQLRVHCKYIGHPIIGDFLYSDGIDIGHLRVLLHARRLILHFNRDKVIDCDAGDPFMADSMASHWKPANVISSYDDIENLALNAHKDRSFNIRISGVNRERRERFGDFSRRFKINLASHGKRRKMTG